MFWEFYLGKVLFPASRLNLSSCLKNKLDNTYETGKPVDTKQCEPLGELPGHRAGRGIAVKPSRLPGFRRWIGQSSS